MVDGAVTAEKAAALTEANERAPLTASERAKDDVDEAHSIWRGEGGTSFVVDDILHEY